jgi:hypothetical protein
MYSPHHLSFHQLQSEQDEVEGMDMIEEQDHLMNHRLGEDGMNMVSSNMVEVDSMDTVEEYFYPMNHKSEVEGMYTVDTGMGEDRAAKLEVVESETEGMVLARHWTGDGEVRHR